MSSTEEPTPDATPDPQLVERAYQELRSIAGYYLARERKNHTLQPTALVHEAFLRLQEQKHVDWNGRTHFLAIGASAMRRILIDHARSKRRLKRGGAGKMLRVDDELVVDPSDPSVWVTLDEALKKLEERSPRQARLVELRYFGGLTVQEAAEVLQISKRSVEADWTIAKAWLRRELSEDDPQ